METVRNHYLRAVEEGSEERDGVRENAPDLAGSSEFIIIWRVFRFPV